MTRQRSGDVDRSEVEIPYRGGPLDGQRELCAPWELDEILDGTREPDVYEHPEEWSPGWSAATTTVHRYRLTYVDRHTGWEYRYIGSSRED
jgi:hypothetical protein